MTIFTFDFGIISFYLYLILYKQCMENNISEVNTGIKAMFTEPFPSFVPTTYKLYMLRYCINIVFIPQKNHINPLTFTF